MLGSIPPVVLIFALHACFFGLVDVTEAQNQSQPTTDPNEVAAFNIIFKKWSVLGSLQWNITEPCIGAATDNSSLYDPNNNPAIKCDCSYNNGPSCHIIGLKFYAMGIDSTIPEELWTLTFLSYLDLGHNYLRGTLSPSIGKLTRLQNLNLAVNALSGELPKELGNLTDLTLLGIWSNNFSGSLPAELGNLLKLEQLYMESSGISGEIPSTFAKLQNLVVVWASDNELTGRIPDFIGNWFNLTSLWLEGNSFEGSIPLTFSNLTSLNELRISDVSNGSSALEFIKDMKLLSILVLRNNNISDSIPSNIGKYQSLQLLDLSFNDLRGNIPPLLFNLNSLSYLFLGSNWLTGNLPSEKSASLQTIDLSYNGLSGSIPSWVEDQSLEINLVANNFRIETANSSVLPSGWNCLQRGFPCNRGSGIYDHFAINCGGPQVTSSSGVVFENDNETLGPASYFVTDAKRWAVSNVGQFLNLTIPQYNTSQHTSYFINEFRNTLDSDLFQSVRLSAGSLRYYGLGLKNGYYTVTLQFAETAFEDSTAGKSIGRRVFDIYIQGNRVKKDFDIQKEAGGVSFRAIQRDFKALISENYLEIHLFWAGKGSCCIPAIGTYGPSIAAINATSDFTHNASTNKTGFIVGIVVAITIVFIASVIALFGIRKRRQSIVDKELQGIDIKPYTLSYNELRAATDDFSPTNKLGEGGFGSVYKGMLKDGRAVAVKQLSVASRHGKSQFVAEISTISAVQHRNLIKLYGCCIEGDKRLLVYEYLENNSLDQALFGKNNLVLNWPARFDICLGVARGLAYLHEESRPRIVHRDVKASNILLDSNLNPKISDFGLAKLYDDHKTHLSTRVAGTFGYLAPEYAMRGHLTEKADVFGFGVVALEIVSGRKNSDISLEEDEIYILDWAWHLYQDNREIELVDSNLSDFGEEEAKRVIRVALLCSQTSPTQRPTMSRAVAMLLGDVEVSTVTSRPGYKTDWKFEGVSTFTSTNASNEISDHSLYANQSPVDASMPMLHQSMEEGDEKM